MFTLLRCWLVLLTVVMESVAATPTTNDAQLSQDFDRRVRVYLRGFLCAVSAERIFNVYGVPDKATDFEVDLIFYCLVPSRTAQMVVINQGVSPSTFNGTVIPCEQVTAEWLNANYYSWRDSERRYRLR